MDQYGIEHGQSSPYNPQSNGHAERNVKILKELLLKTENDINSKQFLDGIAQIRNTPRADGISPCQVVFGRSIRTMLPTLSEALGTNEFVESARRIRGAFASEQKIRFNQHAKDLNILAPGTPIWIQSNDTNRWDEKGVILDQVRHRTYKIQLESGKVMFRNRKKIRNRKNIHAQRSSEPTNFVNDGIRGRNPTSSEEDENEGRGKIRRSERIRKRMDN